MSSTDDDPISHVARWKPRPRTLEVRRASGAVEHIAVPVDGSGNVPRRTWNRLRGLMPPDAIEVIGQAPDGVVGRWVATPPDADDHQPDDADADADEPTEPGIMEQVDYDRPPDEQAFAVRWALREVRSIYGDALRSSREVVAIMADALRIQRETFAHQLAMVTTPAPAPAADPDGEPGFGQITSLLQQAMGLMQMQATMRNPAPDSPPAGMRDSSSPNQANGNPRNHTS